VLLINSLFASGLFAYHAREELAHCSVVFDLWRSQDSIGRAGRMLTMISILLTGAIYVSIAVPWILYHKNKLNVWKTLKAISCFAATNIADIRDYSPIIDFFSFVKSDYHPDIMFKDDQLGVTP
jgi:predicted metal-dependent hydrolase